MAGELLGPQRQSARTAPGDGKPRCFWKFGRSRESLNSLLVCMASVSWQLKQLSSTSWASPPGRATLAAQAVSTLKAEGDLVAQIMRAAAVAFGGGRKGDYPSEPGLHGAFSVRRLGGRFGGRCAGLDFLFLAAGNRFARVRLGGETRGLVEGGGGVEVGKE